MASKLMSGSCGCGNLSWVSTVQPEHVDACYCLTCQKVSGEPFMIWMGIPKASLKWTIKSEPFTYRPTVGDTDIVVSERTCCGFDGCNIMLQYHLYPEKTHVAAFTVKRNDFGPLNVGCHIWTRHVPASYRIPEDGVGRFNEFDDIFKARLDEYLQAQRKN